MALAPIALFVYNRPLHTKKTIERLQDNYFASESDLFIFSDAPKNEQDENEVTQVNEVRKYIREVNGFKNIKIIEKERNFGLANSIISGTTEVIDKYGKVIVVEDDLVASRFFLKFMNEALNFYENNKKVFSVTGYNYPPNLLKIPKDYSYDVYFCPRCSSWGWGTWKDRWDKADWELKDIDEFLNNKRLRKIYSYSGEDKIDMLIAQRQGKIDSWATRWEFTHFKNDGYCLYPVKTFLDNIGFDGSGINCGMEKKYCHNIEFNDLGYNIKFLEEVKLDQKMMKAFSKIFAKDKLGGLKKVIKKALLYDKWNKGN